MNWKYSDDKKRIIYEDNEFYKKSQNNTFRPDDGPVHKRRNEQVIKILLDYGPITSAIDIGPRLGVSEVVFKEHNIADVLGIEIAPRNVKQARSMGRNVIEGDAHELSKIVDKKVDVTLSIHSLEHCHDPEKVLRECYSTLNKHGRIGIRVPVQKDLTVQRNKPGIYGELPPHFCVFTEESLENMLIDVGFEVLWISSMHGVNEIIVVGRKND